MRSLLFILLIMSVDAEAQLPRNTLDQYEYAQEITLNAPDSLLKQRARNFFRQPFIIHWDSVAFVEAAHTGKGHIMMRINHWFSGFTVPIALTLEIEVKDNGYRYSIRHLEADKKNSIYLFPLEQKPEAVNSVVYEQLLQKTQRYIGSTISMLKRFMQGDL
ncbi:hypothetical protein D3H65_32100 [Paraflavitalea soli]|uniref:DUF4468 domain-containing protein n=1 Tax=Paraflavitalea soli TaxID=2315862 RepID=A0A3B7MUZ4_9BACT|nr:hypothetical protein [Paraflavitalea soli]AXY78354.1 hypothetical protein D3H65_32100 [Paraflavitalea soli]